MKMQSPTIMEVSPRDGLQNEPELVSTQNKLSLIQRAIDAGCKRVEVTSFVHPKRVPQMADAEAVCAGLKEYEDVSYTGLILNWRGLERAIATEKLHEVGMVVIASDTFGQKNQGQTIDEAVAEGVKVLRGTREAGLRHQACIAVAFGCPFEGDVPINRVVEIACELAKENPVEIALADTIGVGVPGQVLETFTAVREAIGPEIPLRAHFHNTRNTGIANAFAALQAGVEIFDASIGGIGGCPFAPRATGNIATEDLLYMLDRMGGNPGISLEHLINTADWLQQDVLGKPLPSMLMKAGGFPIKQAA